MGFSPILIPKLADRLHAAKAVVYFRLESFYPCAKAQGKSSFLIILPML